MTENHLSLMQEKPFYVPEVYDEDLDYHLVQKARDYRELALVDQPELDIEKDRYSSLTETEIRDALEIKDLFLKLQVAKSVDEKKRIQEQLETHHQSRSIDGRESVFNLMYWEVINTLIEKDFQHCQSHADFTKIRKTIANTYFIPHFETPRSLVAKRSLDNPHVRKNGVEVVISPENIEAFKQEILTKHAGMLADLGSRNGGLAVLGNLMAASEAQHPSNFQQSYNEVRHLIAGILQAAESPLERRILMDHINRITIKTGFFSDGNDPTFVQFLEQNRSLLDTRATTETTTLSNEDLLQLREMELVKSSEGYKELVTSLGTGHRFLRSSYEGPDILKDSSKGIYCDPNEGLSGTAIHLIEQTPELLLVNLVHRHHRTERTQVVILDLPKLPEDLEMMRQQDRFVNIEFLFNEGTFIPNRFVSGYYDVSDGKFHKNQNFNTNLSEEDKVELRSRYLKRREERETLEQEINRLFY